MRSLVNPLTFVGVLHRRPSLWAGMLVALLLTGIALGQGPIDVSETGLHDSESIYGINGIDFSTPWTNNQIITVLGWGQTDPNLYTNVSFYAYGIYSTPSLTSTGAVDVNALGGNAQSDGGVAANSRAHGIRGLVDVNNSGDLAVTAIGGNATHTSTSGDAYAAGLIYGIQANGSVVNSGDIFGSATGGTVDSNSQNPYAGAGANAQAFGIYAANTVDNTGDITILATGGTAISAGSATTAQAFGLGIHGGSGLVSNAGDISVTAVGGIASDGDAMAVAYGIMSSGGVDNSGDITVSATASQEGATSMAYGIYMGGGEGASNLTNTGTIRAFGDTAYELYVGGGTATLVNAYNVTLDGNPEDASIFVANGATLNLNNAALTVTDVPSGPGATQFNTEYQLFEVAPEIEGEGDGTVNGNFTSVSAVNPDVTAYYYTQGTANAADDTVALGYEPQQSETLASATIQRRMVGMAPYAINQHMTSDLMYDMLALDELDEPTEDDAAGDTAQGLTACQRSGGAFLQPHYSYIKRDDDPLGYNAGMTGVSGGYSQCVNSSLLGLHVGYGKANIDYTGAGYSANTEDQGVVTSGFSGMTRWRPWLLRYGFSGFRGWHDYRGLTGLGLTESESASYDSYGGTGLVMVGRTFKHKKHVFLPEVGANWLWVHRESYTTEATDPAWDTTYSTLNEHDVWAQAALHWQSLYRYKKMQITPSASVGIHQLLTDGESKVYQSVPGAARVMVEDEMDETALSLATAVVIRNRRTAVTLAYDGDFSSDIEQHNFWVKCRLRF